MPPLGPKKPKPAGSGFPPKTLPRPVASLLLSGRKLGGLYVRGTSSLAFRCCSPTSIRDRYRTSAIDFTASLLSATTRGGNFGTTTLHRSQRMASCGVRPRSSTNTNWQRIAVTGFSIYFTSHVAVYRRRRSLSSCWHHHGSMHRRTKNWCKRTLRLWWTRARSDAAATRGSGNWFPKRESHHENTNAAPTFIVPTDVGARKRRPGPRCLGSSGAGPWWVYVVRPRGRWRNRQTQPTWNRCPLGVRIPSCPRPL
jgi:hypothetical protein